MMTQEERSALVDLRVALAAYTRSCAVCGGSGRLRSYRRCPCCSRALAALDASEPLLRTSSSAEIHTEASSAEP